MADSRLEIKIVADNRQAVSAIGEQARAMGSLAQHVEVAQVSMRKMSVAVAAGQAAFAALATVVKRAFVDLPAAMLQGAVASERLQNAFKALEGSLEGASRQIAFVRGEAARLGIPLAEASDAWMKLAAAARGTALEGEQARRIFSAVAGASATLGLSASETSGALLAISQMMSKGTVQAEELRGQLGERIPGAFQIAARAMGVSTQALGEMLDRGELLASDFLPRFADQLAREIPASADTLQAALNRLGNAAQEWLRLTGSALAAAIDGMFGLKDAAASLGQDDQVAGWARNAARAVAVLLDVARELMMFVPNALRTVGASVAAVARDIKLAFDVAAAAVTQGIGEKGRAAMARALQERNDFVAAFNEDMAQRWFPKQLATRVDEFFDGLARRQAAGAATASRFVEGELTKEQQKTIDALKTADEKLAAEYKAHASNLYSALLSGALSTEQYNEQRRKLQAWYQERQSKIAVQRMPRMAETFDAELAALQASLKTAEGVLEASFRARLLDEESYWQARGQMQRRELDLQAQELQRGMADQQRLIDALSRMRPKDDNQRQDIAERIQQARNRLAELQVRMGEIDGRRMVVDLEVSSNLQRVRQELEDLKASMRDQIAEASGEMTPEMRRAAVERAYRETLRRLEGDAEGQALARRLIDVQAARADLEALQQQWQLVVARMRDTEQSINVQRAQGLITTAQAQERIAQAHRQAAAEMDALLPKMQAVADVLGPQAQQRVREFATEMQGVAAVIDPVAASLQTSVKQGFEDMFVSLAQGAKTAKDAFADFARSVLAAIQRILAQRLAEQLFAGMSAGSGGGLASFAKWLGFAEGGYVSGPGTGTSDSIPARLSAGEYVVRAAAVRRFGVAFLDAINGLKAPAAWDGQRLALASGGVVPQINAQPMQQPQAIRIVNSIDPAVTHDHLQTPAGERLIVNIIGRNAGAVRAALQG